jgi:hypothetical protein
MEIFIERTNFINRLMNSYQQGVCHIVALPFTLKGIKKAKEEYGNSNISPCKNIIFEKLL